MPKPKHPLTSYNLFFQLERKRILNGTDGLNLPITPTDVQNISKEHKSKGKRKHRKSHGKISFRDLARTIAERWRKLDPHTRQILNHQAAMEKKEYEKRLQLWKAKLAAPKPQDPPPPSLNENADLGITSLELLHAMRQHVTEMAQRIGVPPVSSVPHFPKCLLTTAAPADVCPSWNVDASAEHPPVLVREEEPGVLDEDTLMPSDWKEDPLHTNLFFGNRNDSHRMEEDGVNGIEILAASSSSSEPADLFSFLMPEEMDKLFLD